MFIPYKAPDPDEALLEQDNVFLDDVFEEKIDYIRSETYRRSFRAVKAKHKDKDDDKLANEIAHRDECLILKRAIVYAFPEFKDRVHFLEIYQKLFNELMEEEYNDTLRD